MGRPDEVKTSTAAAEVASPKGEQPLVKDEGDRVLHDDLGESRISDSADSSIRLEPQRMELDGQ